MVSVSRRCPDPFGPLRGLVSGLRGIAGRWTLRVASFVEILECLTPGVWVSLKHALDCLGIFGTAAPVVEIDELRMNGAPCSTLLSRMIRSSALIVVIAPSDRSRCIR